MATLGSPDEFVDGPFGRRRLGGGGDPGGVTDLKYRRNLIRKVSEDEPSSQPDYAPSTVLSPDNLKIEGGANAQTRRKMVADVYGTTAAGAALGFGGGSGSGGIRNKQRESPLGSQLGLGISNVPASVDRSKMTKAQVQREALLAQMEEKRLKKEAEAARLKEEEAEEWRKINEESERVKREEEKVKEKKRQEEQKQLDFLIKQQEEVNIIHTNL